MVVVLLKWHYYGFWHWYCVLEEHASIIFRLNELGLSRQWRYLAEEIVWLCREVARSYQSELQIPQKGFCAKPVSLQHPINVHLDLIHCRGGGRTYTKNIGINLLSYRMSKPSSHLDMESAWNLIYEKKWTPPKIPICFNTSTLRTYIVSCSFFAFISHAFHLILKNVSFFVIQSHKIN